MADGEDGIVSTTTSTVKQEAKNTVKEVSHNVGHQISEAVSNLSGMAVTAGVVALETAAIAHGLPAGTGSSLLTGAGVAAASKTQLG